MPNRKMDAIEVEDAIVGEKWALPPRFKLFSQGLVEPTHGAGTGGNPHQGLSDLPNFVRAYSAHKHLGQCFGHFWFIALVARRATWL